MNFVGETDNRMCEVIFHRILRERKDPDRIYRIFTGFSLSVKAYSLTDPGEQASGRIFKSLFLVNPANSV